MKKTRILEIIIILSIIGIVDSAYSTYEHYQLLNEDFEGSFCDISPGVSCSAVNASPYSEIMGIPTALIGVLWFIIAILLSYTADSKKKLWKAAPFYLFAWSVLGLLTVVWLVYIELFLIGAICLLCTLVHIIVLIILFLSYKTLEKPVKDYVEDIFYKEL